MDEAYFGRVDAIHYTHDDGVGWEDWEEAADIAVAGVSRCSKDADEHLSG
jgi:regulator of PEP synthase PpsR (kinase-PPPase family)